VGVQLVNHPADAVQVGDHPVAGSLWGVDPHSDDDFSSGTPLTIYRTIAVQAPDHALADEEPVGDLGVG
jgi:hypothetical protein